MSETTARTLEFMLKLHDIRGMKYLIVYILPVPRLKKDRSTEGPTADHLYDSGSSWNRVGKNFYP